MKNTGFRYLLDPLFVFAVSAYALNRCVFRPALPQTEVFMRGYFNDLLLIPAALPPLLLLHRKLGLRLHDRPPALAEISLHLLIWSIYLEIIGPPLYGIGTPDLWDAAAYTVGGLLAWAAWLRLYPRHATQGVQDGQTSC